MSLILFAAGLLAWSPPTFAADQKTKESKVPMMVMTVLEAHVPKERLDEVEKTFREGTAEVPPSIVETYLVQDTKDPTLFRLNTVWRSMEDLQKMRSSGVKPKGVQMFEAVGAKPELSIFQVVVHAARK